MIYCCSVKYWLTSQFKGCENGKPYFVPPNNNQEQGNNASKNSRNYISIA